MPAAPDRIGVLPYRTGARADCPMSRPLRPLVPAPLEFTADGTPRSVAYGDVYHSSSGALAQARHVFLAGNGLKSDADANRYEPDMKTDLLESLAQKLSARLTLLAARKNSETKPACGQDQTGENHD